MQIKQLYAVIVHEGQNFQTGHYFTYVKTKTQQETNQWWKTSDKYQEQVTFDIVSKSQAYILLYEN